MGGRRDRDGEERGCGGLSETARFLGGPLDGREQTLGAAGPGEGHVLTHVYLHGWPKIETCYRLGRNADGEWEYHVFDPH
jgi:hypothetical protein